MTAATPTLSELFAALSPAEQDQVRDRIILRDADHGDPGPLVEATGKRNADRYAHATETLAAADAKLALAAADHTAARDQQRQAATQHRAETRRLAALMARQRARAARQAVSRPA